ncbi:MAG: hypothetical protein H7Z42_12175, partial [Roseiflexaceae bacterium]|nr:hypothetical protein [Roseiflexaceae bacterium]
GQPTSPALQRRETGPIDIKDIQYVVRERAAAEPPARFPDLELRAQEQPLGLRQRVSAHWPLPAHSLQERGVALLNKSVRQYLRWYINPVVEQQNSANQTISVALRTFIRLDAQRRAERAVKRHANMNSEF